ncbi:division/cell wall cluster transcriptional repressor MraZ [Riemerella anatipestifer]|uniref:division/cell wall cluster transcriptional repressor MraZ n=2 Tax=Riemerella anatipestifer TaxID=34085 RepID=UPI001372EBA0|nr:division/cell wall cluster transcriptional repressor MraZ [Riemerella anatipestifer]MBT0549421.1 division/cell wall cluster transcriptional repressor MraZ [Riemerella anatipestifer]MBT0555982.1 division/cell wall cluster transcriptional repressor MraZ [Riemerella anatipestifer]MBT0560184.1 division/cell wall cluster transcriptional repressor MraZ [Riemerella anatipestifer]NAV16235.1 division/cell wall cluster transcriptional repressor MraZ [Riemerella anatipestifer]UZX28632.1 division/cell 
MEIFRKYYLFLYPMNYFFETYECKIDDKGRIKLPSALAKLLSEVHGKDFVIKRAVFQKCLEVYPVSTWEALMGRLNKLNRFVKKNVDFIRVFTAGVKAVEVDKSDRVQIPKDLKDFAGMEKEIVISGVGDFFEIWDKKSYEENIAIKEEDFANLAEEVMGSDWEGL